MGVMGWWSKHCSRQWHHRGWTEGYRQAYRELGFGDVNAPPPLRPLSSEITDAHLDGFRRGKEYARSPLHDSACRIEGFREGVEHAREMNIQNAQPPGNCNASERGYYKIGVHEGIMDILDTLRAELHYKEWENAESTRRGGMEVYPEKFLDGLRYAEHLIEKARDNRND